MAYPGWVLRHRALECGDISSGESADGVPRGGLGGHRALECGDISSGLEGGLGGQSGVWTPLPSHLRKCLHTPERDGHPGERAVTRGGLGGHRALECGDPQVRGQWRNSGWPVWSVDATALSPGKCLHISAGALSPGNMSSTLYPAPPLLGGRVAIALWSVETFPQVS